MRLIDADAYAVELWKLRANYQMLDDTHTADKIMHGIFRAEQALKEQPTITAPRWHMVDEPPQSGQECFTAYRSILRSDSEWLYDICYYTDDLARDCPLMDGAEHRPGWHRYESEYGDVECHPKYWMPIEPPKEEE